MNIRFLSRACIPLSLTVPVLAFAQEQDQIQEKRVKSRHPIEEVIVTVSKREESLQEALGSVSAFTGDMLKKNNVQDLNALADMIPGVVVQREDSQTTNVVIRGISRISFTSSPVAFHVNDVFLDMRGEPFYDLDAIELVRGPSGTSFGRNATAGAINAKWKKPGLEYSAGGELRHSGSGEQLGGYFNAPLIGGEGDARLAARVTALARKSDGSLDNLLASDGSDPGSVDDQFLRIYLTSEPTDSLQLGLRAIRYESKPSGANIVFSPSLATRRSGNLEELGATSLPDDLGIVMSRVNETFGDAFDKFTRVDGDVNWSLFDMPMLGDLDVVLIAGELRREANTVFDLDGTDAPILDANVIIRNETRRTAELRFVSKNDSGWDWLLGYFRYRRETTGDNNYLARTFVPLSEVVGTPAFDGEPQITMDAMTLTEGELQVDNSAAVFATLNVDLAKVADIENVELTFGIRRNNDEVSSVSDYKDLLLRPYGGPVDAPYTSTRDTRNLGQVGKFSTTTGEVGARWFFNEFGMTYLKLAKGYKPGIAQILSTGINPSEDTYEQRPVSPEFINAAEIGVKLDLLDGEMKFNTAAFYYDYTDLQVAQVGAQGFEISNAAAATVKGAEVELQWYPSAQILIQGSAAWLSAKYDEYCGNDTASDREGVDEACTEQVPFDFSGTAMQGAPELSAALLASYSFELGDAGSLTLAAKTSWSDEQNRRGVGNDIDQVPAYSSSDIRMTWKSPEEHWELDLFVENIEDNDDIFLTAYAGIPVTGRSGPSTVSLSNNLPSRVMGMTLSVDF